MGMNMSLFSVPPEQGEHLRSSPKVLEHLLYEDDVIYETENFFSLDSHWDLVNFLLAGKEAGSPVSRFEASPLMTVGEEIGSGEARLASASDLSALCQSLQELDEPSVLNNLSLEALDRSGVYPSVWNPENVPHFNWVMEWVLPLTKFVCSASSEGNSIILALL